MTSISIQRLNRWIEKIFNIKGGPTLLDVDSAIRAVYVIQDGVETRAHQGWNRYATNVLSAGVAAQFSAIRFRNPTGSNVIGVFEKIVAITAGATDTPKVILQAGSTDFAGAVVSQRMDPRGQLLPTLIATSGSNASQQGGNFLQAGLATTGSVDFIITINQEVVAAPGDSVTLWGNVLNQAVLGAFIWRERALETSELTG